MAQAFTLMRWAAAAATNLRQLLERLLEAELREQGRVVAFVSSRPEDAEAQAAADLAVGGGFGIGMADLDVRRVAALVSLARGTVAGSRWAGPVALVPVAAGAVLTILGADSVWLAAGCALLGPVTAAVAGTVAVTRSGNLSRT
jgi:hypothetical protein